MKWDETTLAFGEFMIKQFYENEGKYDYYSRFLFDGLREFLLEKPKHVQMNLVKKELVKLGILESDPKYERFKITDIGIKIYDDKMSLEKYLKFLKNEDRRSKRFNKIKAFGEVGKSLKYWFAIIATISTLVVGAYKIYNDGKTKEHKAQKIIKSDITKVIK
ncbi:MAG: hypothetical protein JXR82_05805 [Marinifilaceae bacterium]|nr:hypothetical protein [Marinifilaceae bacterium]